MVKVASDIASWKLERRRWAIERKRLLASLPEDKSLEKVQRSEAHLSRQFDRTLHELQRLQAARQGLRPTVSLAVDVDIDSGRLATGV